MKTRGTDDTKAVAVDMRPVIALFMAIAMLAALLWPAVALAAKPVPPPPPSDPPLIDSLSADAAPPGTVITVYGSDFGDPHRDSYVSFARGNGRTVEGGIVSWTDTVIDVVVPDQALPGDVTVTVLKDYVSNGVFFTPADPPAGGEPVIGSLSATMAPPGTVITIFGSDFGAGGADSWVAFTGANGIVVSWTDTVIEVEVPAKAESGDVTVVVDQVWVSNGVYFVPHDPATIPILDSLSTYSGSPGTEVTFYGSLFGDGSRGDVTFDGRKATIVSWSDTEIVAIVPPAATSGYAGVVVNGVSSNGLYFVPFEFPAVDSLSVQQADPGSQVTFTGSGFGMNQHDGYPVFAGIPAEVVSWSDTEVVAIVPDGAGAGYAGIVQNGLTSNGVFFIPFGSPAITSVDVGVVIIGQEFTVSGSNFGDPAETSQVKIAGTHVCEIVSWTDTEIVAVVPDGVQAGYVGVYRDGVPSNGKWLGVSNELPRVDSVSVSWALPGELVTIRGAGFGDTQYAGYPVFAGTPGEVVSWSDTEIVAVVPVGAVTGYLGVVQNGSTSNGKFFSPFAPPVVDAISTQWAVVGDRVTVTGHDFRDTPGTLTVGGVPVASVVSWSDTEVVFDVPGGVTAGYVGVVQDGFSSNGKWLYIAPRVTSLSSWWAEPGGTLTIYGAGFGDGSDAYPVLNHVEIPVVSWSDTEIVVTIPAGASTGYVGVARNGAISNGKYLVVTTQAHITSVDATSVVPGQELTIVGTDFGSVPRQVMIAGTHVCEIVSWSENEIVARVPVGVTSGYLGVYKLGVPSNGIWLAAR